MRVLLDVMPSWMCLHPRLDSCYICPIPSKAGVNVTVLASEELFVEDKGSVDLASVHLVHELVGKNEKHCYVSQLFLIMFVTDFDEVRFHWQR